MDYSEYIFKLLPVEQKNPKELAVGEKNLYAYASVPGDQWRHIGQSMASYRAVNGAMSCYDRRSVVSRQAISGVSQAVNGVTSGRQWCHVKRSMVSRQVVNGVISGDRLCHVRRSMISCQAVNGVMSGDQ